MPELEGFERRVLQSGLWRTLTQRITLPWALRRASLPADADVLEVGSGGGYNAEVLLERWPGWRLTASDYDAEMVSLARGRLERFGGRVRVEQADATSLALTDASFDVMISMFVWHHVGDWRKALAESARVLRPGGKLLLVDLTSAFFPSPMAKLFPPTSHYSIRDLRAAIPEGGFARWQISSIGPFLYRALAQTETG